MDIVVNNEIDAAIPIGTVFIKNIDCQNYKGEFGIFVGEQEPRGKEYGLQAARMILAHAFENLKLNCVYLTECHDNAPLIMVYEKAGSKKEGLLKHDYSGYDGYCNVSCMGMTLDKREKL